MSSTGVPEKLRRVARARSQDEPVLGTSDVAMLPATHCPQPGGNKPWESTPRRRARWLPRNKFVHGVHELPPASAGGFCRSDGA
jgi:hypothetical protein